MKINVKRIAIGLGIMGILSSGCLAVESVASYFAQFPDTIIKMKTEVAETESENITYPKEMQVSYALPKDSPLLETGYAYGLNRDENGSWQITVLKKEKDGYLVQEGKEKGFLVEDMHGFGLNAIMEPTKQNGTFTITFYDASEFVDFIDAFQKGANGKWADTFLYMKEQKEGKNHEE